MEYPAEGVLLLGRLLKAGIPVCFEGMQAYVLDN